MKKTQIGMDENFPYCIRDGELYCSTLCKNGRWERSPNDHEVKAFVDKQSAEDYAQKQGFIIYQIVP